MAILRGMLTDPDEEASVEVEATIESPEAVSGGTFEFADSDAILQAALEGRTFRLSLDDGNRLEVRLGAISPGEKPGTSRAEFSSV
jgi:hypothetical protein